MRRKYEQEEENEKRNMQNPSHMTDNYLNSFAGQTNTNLPNTIDFGGPVYATPSSSNYRDLPQMRLFDNITPQTVRIW